MGIILIISTLFLLTATRYMLKERKNRQGIIALAATTLLFSIGSIYYFIPFDFNIPEDRDYTVYIEVLGSSMIELDEAETNNLLEIGEKMSIRRSICCFYPDIGGGSFLHRKAIVISINSNAEPFRAHIYLLTDPSTQSYMECNGKKYFIRNTEEIVGMIKALTLID